MKGSSDSWGVGLPLSPVGSGDEGEDWEVVKRNPGRKTEFVCLSPPLWRLGSWTLSFQSLKVDTLCRVTVELSRSQNITFGIRGCDVNMYMRIRLDLLNCELADKGLNYVIYYDNIQLIILGCTYFYVAGLQPFKSLYVRCLFV